MSIEDLKGKECMVAAVISATGRPDATDALERERLAQLNRNKSGPLDPLAEMNNLKALLREIGESDNIELRVISSIADLRRLAEEHGSDLFVGFKKGPDTPPHIAHLGLPTHGGFNSSQQFTSDEVLAQQLMEQGEISIFIRRK